MNEIKFDERGTGSKNVVWGRGVGEQEVPGVDRRWVREDEKWNPQSGGNPEKRKK